MKYFEDERNRDGVVAAFLAVATALALRFLVSKPSDFLHYAVLSDLTGIDFGDWPDIFYTGGGGDGEVFAVLAADPLGTGPSQLIPAVIYRFARVGFSWLAWTLSFGREGLVLPALFLVGLVSVATVGFLSGFWRQRLGAKSWLLVLNPALFIGFVGDTAEPLGILLLVLAFTGSGPLAAAALGITRPTYATALLGRWRSLSVAVASGVAVVILAVQLFDAPIFGTLDGAFSLPFIAYFSQPSIGGFAVLGAGVATLVAGLVRKDLAWLASGLIVLVLGEGVTANPINAVRAVGMLPVLWALTVPSRKATNPRHSD